MGYIMAEAHNHHDQNCLKMNNCDFTSKEQRFRWHSQPSHFLTENDGRIPLCSLSNRIIAFKIKIFQ